MINMISQLFKYEGAQVRTVTIDNHPWFVLNDLCDALEDLSPRVVRQRLSDDVCSTYPIPDSLGRMQDNTIVNEDGMYDVVLESRKPKAKAFRKWITGDVLPTIRKHGTYMTPETIEKTLTNPDFIIRLATELKTEQQRRIEAEAKIEADKPLMLFAESLQTSEDSILIRHLANLLNQNSIDIGQNRLFDILRNEGYLIKSGSAYNMPTQRSMDLKIMEIKTGTRNGSDGTIKITYTPKITGKGQSYFINKFKSHKIAN